MQSSITCDRPHHHWLWCPPFPLSSLLLPEAASSRQVCPPWRTPSSSTSLKLLGLEPNRPCETSKTLTLMYIMCNDCNISSYLHTFLILCASMLMIHVHIPQQHLHAFVLNQRVVFVRKHFRLQRKSSTRDVRSCLKRWSHQTTRIKKPQTIAPYITCILHNATDV